MNTQYKIERCILIVLYLQSSFTSTVLETFFSSFLFFAILFIWTSYLQEIGGPLTNQLLEVKEASGYGIRSGDQLDPRGRHRDDRLEDGVLDPLDLLLQQPDFDLKVVVAFALLLQVLLKILHLVFPVLAATLRRQVVPVPHASVLDVVGAGRRDARVVGRPAGARQATLGPGIVKKRQSKRALTHSSADFIR